MIYSHLDLAMQNCVAWNVGKTVGTKRPSTQKHIWGDPLPPRPRTTAAGSSAA